MNGVIKILLVIGLLLVQEVACAENAEHDEDFSHHRASITGALNSSDSYELELSYHYMICKYLGVGGSFGWWQNYFVDGHASGKGWSIDYDNDNPRNIFIRPSLVVKSPALRIKQVLLSLYAEPGLMLNLPYTHVCIDKLRGAEVYDYEYISTNRGQWLAWDVHAGINVEVGPFGAGIGYLMSNLDIYSYFRNLSYDGISFRDFYPKKTSFIQGAYLTFSYYFHRKSPHTSRSKRGSNTDGDSNDAVTRMRHVEWVN